MTAQIIVTDRNARWVKRMADCGTKRQRAKYRNTYAVLCGRGYFLGRFWQSSRADRRLCKMERRRGVPLPIFEDEGGMHEPMWDGVKGMVGSFWAHDTGSRSWIGRAP